MINSVDAQIQTERVNKIDYSLISGVHSWLINNILLRTHIARVHVFTQVEKSEMKG